eukprot:COSAG06_NODE_333_length_17341_cov_7.601032_17_plen_150_part_00
MAVGHPYVRPKNMGWNAMFAVFFVLGGVCSTLIPLTYGSRKHSIGEPAPTSLFVRRHRKIDRPSHHHYCCCGEERKQEPSRDAVPAANGNVDRQAERDACRRQPRRRAQRLWLHDGVRVSMLTRGHASSWCTWAARFRLGEFRPRDRVG